MNANDATLTELATAQTGSMVHDDAPNAPAGGGFDLIVAAAAGSALGSPAALTISAIGLTTVSQPWPPQILHPAFDAASRWEPRRHRPPTRAAVMRRQGGNPC